MRSAIKPAIKGFIVTAAFIGPGTVTTASLAGATLGYQIVWALVFSIVATCVLQIMAHRLGTFGRIGLSQACLQLTENKPLKLLISLLILSGILVGNAAYEGGNITGAGLGLQNTIGGSVTQWAIIIGSLGTILLVSRQHQLIEKCLVFLVVLMSVVFISVMLIAGVNLSAVFDGLNPLNTDFSETTLLLAIIGTTIVPYNLFLLSGMSANSSNNSRESEWPLIASIGFGGLITFAIISSAASAFFYQGLTMTGSNIGSQLSPVLGDYAELFFSFGLFAAGLSSALTAPLATGYAVSGLFGWQTTLQDKRFLGLCLLVLLFGVVISSLGFKPIPLIVFAQAANAILLPIVILLLVIVCNQQPLLGNKKNGALLNVSSLVIFSVVVFLSFRKLVS